jgi:hypothetical protein
MHVEINEGNSNVKKTEAPYSELAIAREPSTFICV